MATPKDRRGLQTHAPYFDPEADIARHHHHLPHWQQGERWIFLTYRLGDSLPKAKLAQWEKERSLWLTQHPEPWDTKTEFQYHHRFTEKIDHWLDQGHGSCLLKNPEFSKIVADAFHHFDGKRYYLGPFVVMPNHIHLLFKPLEDDQLPKLVQSWKRFTAREINKRLNREGRLWQEDYWDRLIRSQEHFDWVVQYIKKNPEKLPQGSFRLWSAGL